MGNDKSREAASGIIMRANWRLLGSSETKHLSKILLEYLDPAEEPMACYKSYLKSTVSFTVAHRSVSLLSPKLLGQFYMEDQPLAHPKYFDFFEGGNLSKLENCLNKRLVVLIPNGEGNTWNKVHDKRVYDAMQSLHRQPLEVLYFAIEFEGGFWKCYELKAIANQPVYNQIMTETLFFDPKTLRSSSITNTSVCLVSVLSDVLNVVRGPRQQEQHAHSPACHNLRELVFAGSKNSIARDVGAEFILASHLRTKALARHRQRSMPSNNHFGVHSVFAFSESSGGLQTMPVVCVSQDSSFYRLLEEYADSVRSVQTRRRHPRQETFPGAAAGLKCRPEKEMLLGGVDPGRLIHQVDSCPCTGCKNAKNYEHNMSPNGPQTPFKSDLSTFDLFRLLGKFNAKVETDLLNVCRLSIASFDVESVATGLPDHLGNEDLNLAPDTLSDHRLPRQVQSVHLPCRIGYVDQLRLDTGRPTLIFRYDPDTPEKMVADFVECIFEQREEATTIKYGVLNPYFEMIERYKRAHFLFYQRKGWLPADYAERWQYFKPTDNEEEEGQGEEEDEDEEEEEEDAMLNRLGEEAGAEVAEALTAQELYGHTRPSRLGSPNLEDFEEPTTTANAQEGTEAARKAKAQGDAQRISDIEGAWENCIFGILEKRLRFLAHGFTVYGFNRYTQTHKQTVSLVLLDYLSFSFSESFDLVILCSQIVVFCKQTGRQDVSIHREGSRIRHMMINGVRLGEIKRLLAPGTSLSSLGESCNIPDQKGIFPFAQFTNLAFLEEEKLPSDCRLWASDLNANHAPTQAQVDVALALFEEKKFANISAYLEYYLNLDCLVLQKSIVVMHQEYYNILQLSFIDSRKHTVSSFASCAAQTFLARQKRGANFFPNFQRLYSLLKLSLRGGLTLVARTMCGKFADTESYVKLLQAQLEGGGPDGGPDEELARRVQASGLGLHDYATHCNPHILPRGESEPAISAVYADINRCVYFVSLWF